MQYICCLIAIIYADLDICLTQPWSHRLFLFTAQLNWRERDLKQIPVIVNSKM